MDPNRHFEVDGDVGRYEALLQMADLMVHHRGVPDLLPELAKRLHRVASFEIASFSFYDPQKKVMRMHFWEGSERLSDLTELPVEESACGFVWQKQQPMVWPDLRAETRFQRAVSLLTEKGVRSYCTLPLTTAEKRFGALGLGSSRPNAYGEDDVQLLRRVAELVALALENAMTRAAFLEEKQRVEMLLEVSTALMSNLDVRQLFPAISDLIRKVVRQDYASIALYEEGNQCLRIYAMDSPLADELIGPGVVVPIAESACGTGFLKGETKLQSCRSSRDWYSGRDAALRPGNSIVLRDSADYSKGQTGDPEPGQRLRPRVCVARHQRFEAGCGPGGHRAG
jgi:formate hydrogenlyase transcriptional activator